MLQQTLGAACALGLTIALASCAASVQVAPAAMTPLSSAARDLRVGPEIPVRLATGYTRSLPAGSHWRAVGTLPQGTVYQPVNTVFAIEGRQVHEAWLVVQGGSLQGFYLPGEGNFSPLATAIPLTDSTGAQR